MTTKIFIGHIFVNSVYVSWNLIVRQNKNAGLLCFPRSFSLVHKSSTSRESNLSKGLKGDVGECKWTVDPNAFHPFKLLGLGELFLVRLHQSLHLRLIFDSHATCIPDKIWAARLLPLRGGNWAVQFLLCVHVRVRFRTERTPPHCGLGGRRVTAAAFSRPLFCVLYWTTQFLIMSTIHSLKWLWRA